MSKLPVTAGVIAAIPFVLAGIVGATTLAIPSTPVTTHTEKRVTIHADEHASVSDSVVAHSDTVASSGADVLAAAESAEASAHADEAGPLLPFDGCKGIGSYIGQDWFRDADEKAKAMGVYFHPVSTPIACLSDEYMIAVVMIDLWRSIVVRYDRADGKFATARLEGPGPSPVANTFGKRVDNLVPLVLDSCRSGTYDVRRNIITADGERCEVKYCELEPFEAQIVGSSVFPISPDYKHLIYLGQLFTAADCGEARLTQRAPDGLFWEQGLRIVLAAKASPGLEKELRTMNFQCIDAGCIAWELRTSITVQELLKLRPYAAEMVRDECAYCN